jgi:hypothetical protein
VMERDHDRVIREIREFAETYSQNHIVITCRIAAREYIFQQFTEVEMADFDDDQIQSFADKWFKTQEKNPESTTGEMFWKELESRKPVKELAANPLLLTLLCLEFDNSSAFPQSRSELYDRALNVLLSKWDGQRRILRGEEVYKGLSLKRKETLLGQLAMYTFDRGDYFFKEKVATQQIEQYIRNLPGAQEDPAALEVDSRAVLKSIESRHGLLSERATGIYSFSHLTFQEYFTAKNILDLSNPAAQEAALGKLVEHVGEKRWKEVFLLVVEGLDNADYLIKLIHQKINLMPSSNKFLSKYLIWVDQKSKSISTEYKSVAVRAYYISFGFSLKGDVLARALDKDLEMHLLSDNLNSIAVVCDDLNNINLQNLSDEEHSKVSGLIMSLGNTITRLRGADFEFDANIPTQLNSDLDLDASLLTVIKLEKSVLGSLKGVELTLSGIKEEELMLVLIASSSLDKLLEKVPDGSFQLELKRMQDHLPDWVGNLGSKRVLKKPDQFLIDRWITKFRKTTIIHRNIGHDWKFTDEQKVKLQEYYDANLLLANCLNSECYVSREVREEIEATMLLPVAEIEKWKAENGRN